MKSATVAAIFEYDIKYRSIIHVRGYLRVLGVCDFIFRTDARETKFQLQPSTTDVKFFSWSNGFARATAIFHSVESTSSGMWNAMSVATALNVKCIVKYL